MEEGQTQAEPQMSVTPEASAAVSFPTVGAKPRNKKGSWIWVILIVIVAAGIGGFFILKGSTESIDSTPSPAPLTEEPVEEATPSPSPKAVKKDEVKIEVLNGTGISGEAAFLVNQLKALGYTEITAGNADSQDQTKTTVTFSATLDTTIKDEITKKLKDLYKEVEVKTGKVSGGKDISIVTGLRKGAATAKPSASGTPRPSTSPTPTPITSN